MSRRPVRARLTLAFTGVMALVLAVAGLLFYLRFESVLNRNIDDALRARADSLSALLRVSDRRNWQNIVAGKVGFTQVLDRRAHIIASTPPVAHLALLSAHRVLAAREQRVFLETGRIADVGKASRLLAQPVSSRGHAVLIVGISLRERERANEGLAAALLLGGPLAVLLASVAGYGLAAAALRPVESMRQRAARISATELDSRLPVPPTQDEIARLATTLNAMLDRLADALAHERTFVADASHELRTPLAVLTSELELALRRDRPPEELRDALRSAGRQTDRLTRLADDLLSLTRSDNEQLALDFEDVSVTDLLGDAAARFRPRVEHAGRELTLAVDPGVTVHGDAMRLEQTVENLLENALKHGAGRIALSGHTADGWVEIHVTDQGTEFPIGFVAQAFERFSRAPAARTRAGSGLGLAIVRAIAEAHGGTAGLTVGREGTDAWLRLPLDGSKRLRETKRRRD